MYSFSATTNAWSHRPWISAGAAAQDAKGTASPLVTAVLPLASSTSSSDSATAAVSSVMLQRLSALLPVSADSKSDDQLLLAGCKEGKLLLTRASSPSASYLLADVGSEVQRIFYLPTDSARSPSSSSSSSSTSASSASAASAPSASAASAPSAAAASDSFLVVTTDGRYALLPASSFASPKTAVAPLTPATVKMTAHRTADSVLLLPPNRDALPGVRRPSPSSPTPLPPLLLVVSRGVLHAQPIVPNAVARRVPFFHSPVVAVQQCTTAPAGSSGPASPHVCRSVCCRP